MGTAAVKPSSDARTRELGAEIQAAAAGRSVVGVGVDLVELDRLRLALERRARFGPRCFSRGELAHAHRRKDPVPSLAARFAAKEAVMKSLGVGLWKIDLHDVEVVSLSSGAPTLAVRGRAERLAARAGIAGWHCSLTHTDTTALAVVLALA